MADDWSALGAVHAGKTATWQIPGSQESKDRILMNEEDYGRFKQHAEALCFDSGPWGQGKYGILIRVGLLRILGKVDG